MLTEPYDPLWISTYNIHPSILDSFLSNQTLERLFNNDAIKVGDQIYYRSSHEFTEEGVTIQVEKMAKVCSSVPYYTVFCFLFKPFQEKRFERLLLSLCICISRSQA